jgi:very-short-patch-repair endonuclease
MAFLADAPDRSLAPAAARDPQYPPVGHSESLLVPTLSERSGVSVGGSIVDRIAAVASVQRGFVSRGQLRAAAISSTAIARLIAKRWLRPKHHGVFAVGHDAPAELGEETAALLAVRTGAALSHLSAARLWGMTTHRGKAADIHVTVPGDSPGGRPEGVHVHRSKLLTSRDVRIRHGLPVTSPARALLDMAPSATSRELERMLDQGLVMRLLRLADVVELLRRCGRHRGRAALQALVDQHTTTTFTRSEAEELFLSLVRQAQLPQPLVNVRRHGYEIDFLWPQSGLAVEIDGFAFHRTSPRFEHDHSKDAALRTVGIVVDRVTWRQLDQEPLAVIARVAAGLRPPQGPPDR